ncbi:MAG: helix-turn-helix transcriptional regulator [Caulobacter sp.]|nr:helix-turn-helix transcriptional regulator [Caulobacter sp.]
MSAAKSSVQVARGRPGRPKPRVDRAARGQAVLAAAVEVFTEKGLQAATVQDVADRLGMAKILVYRLYPSRQAIVDALFADALKRIEAAAATPWGGYGSSMAGLIALARSQPDLFLLLLRDARAAPEAAAWAKACDDLLVTLGRPFIAPPAGASDETRAACLHAVRSFVPFFVQAWVAGIERRDGMSDEARIEWFGQIVRAWRTATYQALDLGPPPTPPPLRAS